MDNNLNLTPEMLEQAKSAPSATELLNLAQENGITLTAEEAETYYAQFHSEAGALSDEELDNVSGGGWCSDNLGPEKCRYCGRTEFQYTPVKGDSHWCWICKHCHQPY